MHLSWSGYWRLNGSMLDAKLNQLHFFLLKTLLSCVWALCGFVHAIFMAITWKWFAFLLRSLLTLPSIFKLSDVSHPRTNQDWLCLASLKQFWFGLWMIQFDCLLLKTRGKPPCLISFFSKIGTFLSSSNSLFLCNWCQQWKEVIYFPVLKRWLNPGK